MGLTINTFANPTGVGIGGTVGAPHPNLGAPSSSPSPPPYSLAAIRPLLECMSVEQLMDHRVLSAVQQILATELAAPAATTLPNAAPAAAATSAPAAPAPPAAPAAPTPGGGEPPSSAILQTMAALVMMQQHQKLQNQLHQQEKQQQEVSMKPQATAHATDTTSPMSNSTHDVSMFGGTTVQQMAAIPPLVAPHANHALSTRESQGWQHLAPINHGVWHHHQMSSDDLQTLHGGSGGSSTLGLYGSGGSAGGKYIYVQQMPAPPSPPPTAAGSPL